MSLAHFLESPPAAFDRFKRYIPLAVWVVVVLTILLIPLKIISYGYIPDDDVLRHAAKAVSGKSWSEILVMRSDFPLDFHQGWHTILGWFHHFLNADAETLVLISMVGLMVLVNLSALSWLRRPEAWLAALMAGCLAEPIFISRLTYGRPFLFSMAVFVTLLFLWSAPDDSPPRLRTRIATVCLVAVAAWIHGSAWYLLVMPALGLALAGMKRSAIWFGCCWLLGSFLGACLTGHPWQFASQSVRLVLQVFGGHALTRQLVGEVLPSNGDFSAVVLVIAMLVWRSCSSDWTARELINPIFITSIIGWILGLKVLRFSADWGMPALLLWLALEFQKQFEQYLRFDSWRRLLISLGLAGGVFLLFTGDTGSRWTWNLTNQYLTEDNPELAGWLPDKNGIIYSADMEIFYFTFFKNPTAQWRYVLGFEPALMRPDDFAVVDKALWNFGDLRAYEPWVKKMRPEDRLILRASYSRLTGRPNIPELEWFFAENDYWIGRLPRTNSVPASP
jgi:hypothetical protein